MNIIFRHYFWMATGCMLLAMTAICPLVANAQSYRVGIFHPLPRLCHVQPHAQRDLRVLRLVYGLGSWNELPWFYELQGKDRLGFGLKTNLFREGLSKEGLSRDGLSFMNWQQSLSNKLPLASLTWGISNLLAPPLVQLSSQPLPALITTSRLQGVHLLPFPDTQPKLSLATSPETIAKTETISDGCRWWPRAVRMEHASHREKKWWYRLFFPQSQGEIELRGYRQLSTLWQDYQNGSLEAVLVEGEDLAFFLKKNTKRESWGQMTGGQQWILRSSKGKKEQPLSIRQSLRLTIPRNKIATSFSNRRLSPTTHFLRPLLDPSTHLTPLVDNAQQARIQWFQKDNPPTLQIAVIANPWMEHVARQISQSWQRNLRLRVVVSATPVHRFANSIPQADFFLDIVDLNDGTLQDLWTEYLNESLASPSSWEAELQANLPYMPLFSTSHYAFCKKSLSSRCLKSVCPSCTRYLPPDR